LISQRNPLSVFSFQVFNIFPHHVVSRRLLIDLVMFSRNALCTDTFLP
jgi:hypothetical protein